MNKGSPQRRILMAAVKAFLGAFATTVFTKLETGGDFTTVTEWKALLVSAAVAGAVAIWKFFDIMVESER